MPGPLFYGYYKQRMSTRFTIVIRSSLAASLGPTVRDVIREVDPGLPVQVRTIEDAFDRALTGRRFSVTLIGTFSVAALVLATLGIYGLISYLVAERTREIGIRLALGAETRDVLRLVVGKGVVLAIGGITVGVVVALGLTRYVEGMLFGITAPRSHRVRGRGSRHDDRGLSGELCAGASRDAGNARHRDEG